MFNELFKGNNFDYDMTQNQFIGIRAFFESDHADHGIVRGMYVSKTGKYGPSSVLIIDGWNINLPKHMNERVDVIRHNPEMVKAINEGHCGFKIREYPDKKDPNVTRLTVDFYDI